LHVIQVRAMWYITLKSEILLYVGTIMHD
jgi:hypothetical protein